MSQASQHQIPQNQTPKHQTTIQFSVTNTPAVLERLLRTIRVRGFSLEDLAMKSDNQLLEIKLSLSGERSISMLINQLTKLVDVKEVYLLDNNANQRMSA